MLKAYGGKRKGRYYQVNNDALQAFQRRRDSGMNLSQKLWNQAEDYKRGLEHTLSVAIEKGMSAVTLSKRVSKYLEDFPSMKKDYGERFGRATDIHDCEYRSIRLARSEINMAYRSAEQMRWEQMDFIIGYEVKLSGNHNCKGVPQGAFYDICDDLKGRYPKDFKWLGWHPNCRCYVVPIIKSEERFWEDEGKRGDDNEEITELPDNFKQWATQNKDRIDKAEQRGTQPYFVRDNRERVKQAVISGDLAPSGIGHKAGGLIKIDEKRTNAVHSALDKQVLATLTDAQTANATQIAEILKIKLGRPMPFKDMDNGNVNPKHGQSNAFDYNCALTVLAGEARARGLNVEALGVTIPKRGKTSIAYQLGNDISMAWIDPSTNQSPTISKYAITDNQYKKTLDEIYSNITEDGRYYIGLDGTKANHALNVYRVKGKLYIYDQQINGSYDLLTFLKEKGATSIEVLRLDTLLIDTTYIDRWITAR